jgi:CRISPR-associated protein Csb3
VAYGHASARDRMKSVLQELARCETKNGISPRSPDAIALGPPFSITIDWWHRRRALKTWAGNQNPLNIVRACQDAIERHLDDILEDPLRFSTELPPFGKSDRNIQPFGLDSRRMATAVDIGYSPDALGVPREASPVTELAAFIALQYFQPVDDDEASGTHGTSRPMRYHTWHVLTPWPVACAVYCGAAWLPRTRRWRFHVGVRDDITMGHYRGLTYSQEVQ